MKNKKYIINLGTGRCGTVSLAKLINDCKECNIKHEMDRPKKILSWNFNYKEAIKKLKDIKQLEGKLVGDTAFYYLNYIDFFMDKLPFLKCIAIYRDKEKVIQSYIKKTEIGTNKPRNHWCSNPKTKGYINSIWDKAYPNYDNLNKEKAIGKYWEEYKQEIQKFKEKYPNKIKIFNIEELNYKKEQKQLFDFLKIPEKDRKYQVIRANRLLS